MRQVHVKALVVAGCVVASALAQAGADEPTVEWLQFHGQPSHEGVNAAEHTVGPANISSLSLAWWGVGHTSKFGVVSGSSPAVAGGLVYFGDGDGTFYAFPANGCGDSVCAPTWEARLVESIYNSPAVADGVVYVGTASTKGALYAFSAAGCGSASCRPIWMGVAPSSFLVSSPVVANGFVYAASFADEGQLNVFPADGCGARMCPPLWTAPLHYATSTPAVAGGFVYVGAGDAELKVFDADGCGQPACSPLWIGRAAGPMATMASAPMVANGLVYVGENNGRAYAFRAGGCGQAECEPVWEHITQDPIVDTSPVMVNGTLYVTGTNFSMTPILYVFRLFGTAASR